MTALAGNIAPDWGKNYGLKELWTEVTPGLWVGGTADADVLGIMATVEHQNGGSVDTVFKQPHITKDHFDAVVTMYHCARPVDLGVEELRWGIIDDHASDVDAPLNEDTLRETVEWAHRRWARGQRVLVRCQAGLNRSSLVAALVLRKSGATAQEAIETIRSARSEQCLFNRKFVRTVIKGV